MTSPIALARAVVLLVAAATLSLGAQARTDSNTVLKPRQEAALRWTGDASADLIELGRDVAVDGPVAVAAENGHARVYRLGTNRDGSLSWNLEQRLGLEAPEGSGTLGNAVAISGDTILVSGYGFVDVFAYDGTTWSLQAKLQPEGASIPSFGFSVALDGDLAIAGAPDDGAQAHGAAYAFARTGTDWAQEARLVAPDDSWTFDFGWDVAISGTRTVIGDYQASPGGVYSPGAAWTFTRSGATWTLEQQLVDPDAAAGDQLGESVAIDGDWIVLGAPNHRGAAPGEGMAVTFHRGSKGFARFSRLFSATPASGEKFGDGVAISSIPAIRLGDPDQTVILAGSSAEGNQVAGASRICAFSSVGHGFARDITIASSATTYDGFGKAVALSGSHAFVGAPYPAFGDAQYNGVVRGIERYAASDWRSTGTFHPEDGASDLKQGSAIAMSGSWAAVALPRAVLMYQRVGSAWNLVQTLSESADPGPGTRCYEVKSLAMDGDWLAVGQPPGGCGVPGGRILMFKRSGTSWIWQASLVETGHTFSSGFPWSLALDGPTLVAGAQNQSSPAPGGGTTGGVGAAWVWTLEAGTWSSAFRLPIPQAAEFPKNGENFHVGASVSVDGNRLVVGAPGTGAFAVFTRSGGTWTETAWVERPNTSALQFGSTVAISGDTIVAAARDDTGTGMVFLHDRLGLTWQSAGLLQSDDPFPSDSFGESIALDGDLLAIGADAHGQSDTSEPGHVFLFSRTDGTWLRRARIGAAPGASLDSFGIGLALSDRRLAIGAPYEDNEQGINAGAAYIERLDTDYGDAPVTYHTKTAQDGARHLIDVQGPALGAAPDNDPDGRPGATAMGDDAAGRDDEDGIAFTPASPLAGTTATLNLTVRRAKGIVDAWIDFNRDGDFDSNNEHVVSGKPLAPGQRNVAVQIPANAKTGPTLARVRISTNGTPAPTGLAIDGEVEDLAVSISTP